MRSTATIGVPVDAGDFCLMDRGIVEVLTSLPERGRYLRGLRAWVGFRQEAVEYERSARHAGPPKYTLRKLVRLALDGLLSFSSIPLRMASVLGFVVVGGGLLYLLWAVYSRIVSGEVPNGWTSIVLIQLVLGGVQLIVIGLVGEYLARAYDEAKGRPVYIVARRHGFGSVYRRPLVLACGPRTTSSSPMDDRLHEQIRDVGDAHWWYEGRRRILESELDRWLAPDPTQRILEVGCGSGSLLASLACHGVVEGLEPNEAAVEHCQRELGDIATVRQGWIPDDLPADGSYDVVAAFDVLEHLADDRATVDALRSTLRPGGLFIATVPAFPSLWGAQDELSHHHRRYRAQQPPGPHPRRGLGGRATDLLQLVPVPADRRHPMGAASSTGRAGRAGRPVIRLRDRASGPARHHVARADPLGRAPPAAPVRLAGGGVAAPGRASDGQLTWRSRPSQYGARSLNFWSLPVAVRASSSRNSTTWGT